MTAASAPAGSRVRPARRGRWLTAVRIGRLELRHNAMLGLAPLAMALFWLISYRKAMAMPPLWNPRATAMQASAVVAFACPVAGAAAWMGSREARRRTAGLVGVTSRPRWARLLATWAATTCWALLAYLACVAVLYGVTARQATWGGPLWWPAAVGAASLPALTALGFAAGTLLPSRFTPPLTAIGAFFALALSTQLIVGSQSYWQVSPVVAYPWDIGPDPGAATFYPYLPDLPAAQVLFLAGLTTAVLGALAVPSGYGRGSLRRAAAAITAGGLLAAGAAAALAGTGRLDSHGMIAIPLLHDAAADRPLRYTPVCSHTAVPVCLNPAYASSLPATAAALAPVLRQITGLPGAPARISQAATAYRQEPGNMVAIGLTCPPSSAVPPVFYLLLPGQVTGPALSARELAGQVRSAAGPSIAAAMTGDGHGASPAQQAVTTALLIAARSVPRQALPAGTPLAASSGPGGLMCTAGTRIEPQLALPGTPAYEAAQRFAGLPAAVRHAWLARHLAALREGRISLGQLP